MFFTSASDPGGAGPSEDWAAATHDVVVVLDGATARTDTGCKHGPEWYARKLGAAIIGGAASRSRDLTGVLAEAIRDVAAMHGHTCDLTHPGTPSAAVGIVRVEGDRLRWCVLGDVTVAIETTSGDVTAVSDGRVSATAAAERAEADRHLIGTLEKDAALLAMKHAELAARGRDDGYWIAAADPAAAGEAIVGDMPAADVRRFVAVTDGAARLVDLFGHVDWRGMLDIVSVDPIMAVDLVRRIERADPTGQRFPRNKVSDDATIVHAVPGSVIAPTRERGSLAELGGEGFWERYDDGRGLYGERIRGAPGSVTLG